MQKSQWLAFPPPRYSFKIFNFQFSSTVSQDLNELVWPFCINMIGDHLLHFSCKSYLPSVGSAEFLTQVLTDLSPRRVTYDCGCCCFNSCTVYAEADGHWILSNLHEARGWVIWRILMYWLVHGKHHFLIQAALIGFTFREIETPMRPQRMLITGSEGMKKNKIQKRLSERQP